MPEMNAPGTTCSADNLRNLLDNRLDSTDEAATCEHLSTCAPCRALLEDLTCDGGMFDCDPVAVSLRDDALDAETGAISGDSRWLSRRVSENDSGAIEGVLGQLSPTDDPSMLGRLGPYEVSGVIGAGAMGVVLKGFDSSLDRTVAIKVLAPHLASSGVARQRFAREAKAAATVLHPNVMAIHGVSNEGALPYLVMPYVRGESLQKRLDKQGPLPVAEVLRIAGQVAAGLSAAHAQGLVHRDIKPANIMLEDGVERVAITDFGLARAVDDASLTRSGMIAGTPHFMSPEQARGEAVGASSDQFSLGTVMYVMCTGRMPFRAETSYGLLKRVADNEPAAIREISPDVPQWLCAIIGKLMSKQPDDRFASAEAVAQSLEKCLAHVQQPTVVSLPASVERLRQSPAPEKGNDQPDRASARFAWKWRASARRLTMGVTFAFVLFFAGILVLLELNKGELIIESDADNVPVRITQGDKTVDELTVTKDGTSVRVAAGRYQVELPGEYDGLVVNKNTFTLRSGAEAVVRIKRVQQAEQISASRRLPSSGLTPPIRTKRAAATDEKALRDSSTGHRQWVENMEVSVMGTRLDLLDAQLKLANLVEERISILERQVATLSEREKTVTALHKDGVCSLDEVVSARADRIDAERRLKRERDAQHGEPQRSDVLQFSGTLDYDERRIVNVYARMPARIEELQVDYKGLEVKKGDPLVTLYSSELYAAEEEFLQVYRRYGKRSITKELREKVRQKLRLLGIDDEQVDQLIEQNKPSGRVTLFAPGTGIVTAMGAQQGGRVKNGERLFTIADPTQLWAELHVNEAHLEWLRIDQPVTLTARAYLDQPFAGRIAFIEPRIDPKTHTFAIRVDVSNLESKLKPGMSVTASVQWGTKVLGTDGSDNVRNSAGPTPLEGTVLSVSEEQAEISVGYDDGVRRGQRFHVFDGRTYVGRVDALNVQADKSTVLIDAENAQRPVRPGDRVTTHLDKP